MTELPDFDATYRGTPVFAGSTAIPWNIGEPQPAIAALVAAGEVTSPVLDAGCGVGATVIALAGRGYEVVGVDGSAAAIEQARYDARDHGVAPELAVGDVSELRGHDGRFATIIDSAVFHSLDADRRPDYVRAIARAARPGARLHVLVFPDDVPLPEGVNVNGVTPDQLRELVSAEWSVDGVVESTITVRFPEDAAPERPRDEHGRTQLPAWLLRAHLPAAT